MKMKDQQLTLDVETPESKLLEQAIAGACVYTHLEYHQNFIGSVQWLNTARIRMYFALGPNENQTTPIFVEVECGLQGNSPDKYYHPGTNFIDNAPTIWLRIRNIDRKEFFRMYEGQGVRCGYDIPYDDDIPATLNPFSPQWFDAYGFLRAMHMMILQRIRDAEFVEDREKLPLDQIMLLAAERHTQHRLIRFFEKVSDMPIFRQEFKTEDAQEKDSAPTETDNSPASPS